MTLEDRVATLERPATRFQWSRLTSQQVGRYGEYFAKMSFTEFGLDVYTAEVDDKGIDFVVRIDADHYLDVQVKSVRDLNYIFFRKSKFEPRENLYAAVLLFAEGEWPQPFLIPSEAWLVDSPILVSRDYPNGKSPPEWGIQLSQKNAVHLNQWAFERTITTIGHLNAEG